MNSVKWSGVKLCTQVKISNTIWLIIWHHGKFWKLMLAQITWNKQKCNSFESLLITFVFLLQMKRKCQHFLLSMFPVFLECISSRVHGNIVGSITTAGISRPCNMKYLILTSILYLLLDMFQDLPGLAHRRSDQRSKHCNPVQKLQQKAFCKIPLDMD